MTTTVEITVDELRDRLAHDEPVTILDVRPADERAEWSIPGSQHIDAYARLRAGDEHVLDEFVASDGAQVVTVCAAGRTSLIAADLLRRRGIDAISLTGGMKAWSLAWNTATIAAPGSTTEIIQVRRTGKGCLSYLIGSDGEAAVIDASLDPAVYQEIAAQHGWTITRVLDTHVHADHLSRSRSLAEQTGATLHLPAQERTRYLFDPLRDGDTLAVGAAQVRALAVPGHTNESMAYLLDERALFTGDTLFLTSVGRPDLEASTDEARARATALYHSLQRLFALPDDTSILPGHISEPIAFDGEPIAAPLSDVRERVTLLDQGETNFVSTILSRIPPTPPNHQLIVHANEAGQFPDGDVTDVEAGANRCAVL
jgi:glyoxylase-like metal-dependent hydrolase (beta-lactamase superfamily II)/rhodanese-related sulfurtransferase